jgi:hypothetical protein
MMVKVVDAGISQRLMQVTSRRGKTMAKKRSSVTDTVDRTDPTLQKNIKFLEPTIYVLLSLIPIKQFILNYL